MGDRLRQKLGVDDNRPWLQELRQWQCCTCVSIGSVDVAVVGRLDQSLPLAVLPDLVSGICRIGELAFVHVFGDERHHAVEFQSVVGPAVRERVGDHVLGSDLETSVWPGLVGHLSQDVFRDSHVRFRAILGFCSGRDGLDFHVLARVFGLIVCF